MANQARRKNQDIAHDMPLPWWKSTSSPFSTRSRINADAPGLARSPLTWCLRLANESSCLTALHHPSDYAAWASCTNRAESSVHSCEHRPSPGNVKGHRSQHKPCACWLSCGKAVPRTCCPDFAALRYIHHETFAVWRAPRGSPGPGPWRTIGPPPRVSRTTTTPRKSSRTSTKSPRGPRSTRACSSSTRRTIASTPRSCRTNSNAPFSAPSSIARGVGMGGHTLNFGDQWVLLFHRAGDKVHLIRRNVRFQAKKSQAVAGRRRDHLHRLRPPGPAHPEHQPWPPQHPASTSTTSS